MMKLPRIILGVVLGLAGVVLYAAGGYTLMRAYQAEAAADAQADRMAEQCHRQLSAFKRIKSRPDHTILVDLGEVQDPRVTLSDIAAIAALCPFQPMVEACIGVDCNAKDARRPVASVTLGAPVR